MECNHYTGMKWPWSTQEKAPIITFHTRAAKPIQSSAIASSEQGASVTLGPAQEVLPFYHINDGDELEKCLKYKQRVASG